MSALRLPTIPSSWITLALLALVVGTPGSIRAQSPTSTVSSFEIEAADALGLVREASGLALAPDDSLYVVDRRAERVQRFDAEGIAQAVWGARGTAPGQFREPMAIAVSADGGVYVADTGNHRVQRFDASGRFLGQWGAEGGGPGALETPEGVAVGLDGTIYVSDATRNVVMRFTPDGTLLSSFGDSGLEADRLDRPSQLAVGPNGDIYVIDFGHDRIQVFRPDGTRLRQLRPDVPIHPNREFSQLSALAVGADGTVFAAHGNGIHHFDPSGREKGEYDLSQASISLVISGNDRLLVGAFSFDDFAIGELDVSERFEYVRIFQLGRQIGRPSSVDADGQFSVRKGFYPPRMVLSVAPSGRLYVADAGRLQWFRSDGLFLGSRRDLGIWSVAAATDGTLWTTSGSGIRHLDAKGTQLATFLAPGPGSADDIVVAPDGTLFVVDARLGLVQHLASSGRKLGAWGSPLDFGASGFGICFDWDALGASCGQQLIALSPDGSIVYLLASSRGRVHRYTVEGEWLGGIDGLTAEPEIQQTAQGIAVAPDGSILVADTAAREVIRFAPNGSILERIAGAEGKARGQFDRPGGLAVAPDGAWFVADREHGRVLAFSATRRDSWRGEYYGNPWITEQPLAIAESDEIDFDWGSAAPDPALEAAGWSARFERSLKLAPGTHSFGLQAQGGARMWIGEELAVDAWDLRGISRSGDFEVPPAGEVFVRLEFRDMGGPASLRLSFDGAPVPTETPEPTVIATETPGSPATVTRPASVTWILYIPTVER